VKQIKDKKIVPLPFASAKALLALVACSTNPKAMPFCLASMKPSAQEANQRQTKNCEAN
jgi:hypothetical protein